MAKISDLIVESRRPTFSVELWPPRSEASERKLEQALAVLDQLNPTFTSITYGAGGSTREKTHDLVVKIRKETSIEPMAHLVTSAHSRSQLKAILQRYLDSDVHNVLALKGDPPLDADTDLDEGELKHALELVELARSLGDFSIAVAAHPEGHPLSRDVGSDRKWLAKKLEAADFAITQFFFNADDYYSLVDDMSRLGVDKPILPGVMAPVSMRILEKMAQLSGAKIPDRVHSRLAKAGDDPKALKQVGVEMAIELSAELLSQGAPGIHVYTMNEAATTVEIHKGLGFAQ